RCETWRRGVRGSAAADDCRGCGGGGCADARRTRRLPDRRCRRRRSTTDGELRNRRIDARSVDRRASAARRRRVVCGEACGEKPLRGRYGERTVKVRLMRAGYSAGAPI